MKKAAFLTLGCKVNQYETEAMITILKDKGYIISDFESVCDIYIINTCTVTMTGDRKSRQMIHRAHKNNPDADIIVTGCYAQLNPEEIQKMPGVSLILGTNEKNKIADSFEEFLVKKETLTNVGDVMKNRKYEDMEISSYEDKTRAFVKIEDGCTEFCSYCIIPYARGPVRSRSLESIKKEVNTLANNGYREIVLTGIHLASYGRELKGITLLDAIKALHENEKIKRIRLGSLEPRILTEDFIFEISKLPKVCGHFHISLQSGCEKTLKAMNRKYTLDQYRKSVLLLRKAYDNPSITTDIITGFPGESDEDFFESLNFLKEIGFSAAHIFPFSERKGTKAYDMPCRISKNIRQKRAKIMIEEAQKLKMKYTESFLGKIVEVLFERQISDGIYEGHTSNYLTVRAKSESDISHQFENVLLTSFNEDYALGEIKK